MTTAKHSPAKHSQGQRTKTKLSSVKAKPDASMHQNVEPKKKDGVFFDVTERHDPAPSFLDNPPMPPRDMGYVLRTHWKEIFLFVLMASLFLAVAFFPGCANIQEDRTVGLTPIAIVILLSLLVFTIDLRNRH